MELTVSKWGNSLGIRIPVNVVKALAIKNGDVIDYELVQDTVILKKSKSTKQLFEEFYGKKFKDITAEDIGPGKEFNYGVDVGNEAF